MLLSRILFRACLVAGQWLFVLTAGLALLSIAADWLRGDETGRTDVMLWTGILCLVLAAAFRFGVKLLDSYD